MGIIKMPQWLQEFFRQSEGFCGGEATLTDIVYNCQCMTTVKPVWLKSISEGKQLLSCQFPGQVASEEVGMTPAHPDDA